MEYQTHRTGAELLPYNRCDLLLNLYLWNIKHIARNPLRRTSQLWFAFKFVPLEYQTHHMWIKGDSIHMLWFAFKFVPLEYQTHRLSVKSAVCSCCDLLLNLYLWNIKHIYWHRSYCFNMLWFAFKFVPLEYQTHHNQQNKLANNILQR